MSIFYANYPTAGEAGGANPSVGVNTTPAPTSSTEIGFIDSSGNLQGVSATNPLPITIESEVGTLNTNIAEYGGVPTSLGQKVSASSVPVVIASDQSTLPISAASLPLPTGASTSALQTTGNTSLASILANQTNGTQETTIVGTVPLPTGAATSALQTTGNTSLTSILANQTNGTQTTQVTNFPATQPVSGTVAATQSGAWAVGLTEGGNAGTIKAASTAAIGTDTSLVTALSPNTPLPAGTNALGSVSVTGTVATTSAVNTNGSASNSTTVGSGGATTFSPPTNAVGFVVEAESSNTVNLRYACGTTATTTVGMLLEPGRDSGYIPSSGTVTVIAVSGSAQAAGIQWVLSS